jgi:hypothetical protein
MISYKKYSIYILVSFCTIVSTFAQQTGIGTKTPHTSAMLDVNSTVKPGGLLMPRVNLLNSGDVITIPNPATGLTVFNLQNAGTYPNNVEANRYYSWDGSKWVDLSDMDLVRRLLLPQVFFSQTEEAQILNATDLATINTGNPLVVTFPNNSVSINTGNHITLNNNIFTVNTAGSYEVSGYIGYIPRISNLIDAPLTTQTNIEYNIQVSKANGAWLTVGTTTAVWGLAAGGYVRTLIIPPVSIDNLQPGDRFRAVILKSMGVNHGSGSASSVAVRSPEGTGIAKNMKILKVK